MLDHLLEEASDIVAVLERDLALELVFDGVDQYFLLEVLLQPVDAELYLLLLAAVVREVERKGVEDAALDGRSEEAAVNGVQLCPQDLYLLLVKKRILH